MQKLDGVSFQDAFAFRRRIIELVDNIVRILDVLRGENIRADHDAVRSDHGHQKTKRLRIVNQIIVIESPQVFPERPRQRDLRPDCNDRRNGRSFLRDKEMRLPRAARPFPVSDICPVRRTSLISSPAWCDRWVRQAPAERLILPDHAVASIGVGDAIHLMKNNRVAQLLNPRQYRREVRLDDVVVPFHRVWQVNGAHARLSGDAIQFLKSQLRIANGHLEPQHEAVGMRFMRLLFPHH